VAASYRVHGLTIRSALPLPELAPGADRADSDSSFDVDVRVASLHDDAAALRAADAVVQVETRTTRFRWEDAGVFVVRDGRELLVDPAPGADPRLVRLGVLGPAMAALLQQLGFLPLHASAVRANGGIVAFLGASGAGKSTLAAALHARGLPAAADDITAVRLGDGLVRATTGFAELKLWPDSVAALGRDPEELPRSEADREKRILSLARDRCAEESLPVRCLYVLADGEHAAIEPLTPAAAFLELVRHSYGVTWLHDASGAPGFRSRAEIARGVRMRRLQRPRDFRLLADVVRCVERDLANDES
jgi:hypothetical protein